MTPPDRHFWLSETGGTSSCRRQCRALGRLGRIAGGYGKRGPQKLKGRSLGERPAFLASPPGCGMSKPWGVWEGGFDEAAWGAAGGLSEISIAAQKRIDDQTQKPNLAKELALNGAPSNEKILANRRAQRHLQNCISGIFQRLKITSRISDCLPHMTPENGDHIVEDSALNFACFI